MIRHLERKPDFDATIERFAAWWEGELLDRPPVTRAVASTWPMKACSSTFRNNSCS